MTVQNVTKNALLCSVAFLTALTLVGCKSKSGSGNPPPQLVKFVKVHTEAVPVNTSLPGRVSAFEQAQIRPQVSGVVLKRYFEQGTDVKKDQLLYLINPAPYKAAYETAKAQLLHARAAAIGIRAQYERYKPLVKAHAVSQQDFDNTRSRPFRRKRPSPQPRPRLTVPPLIWTGRKSAPRLKGVSGPCCIRRAHW
ncbi:MAG: biotin/lipoyl-binding protein [Acetobacteraceae bacterium]